MGEVSRGFQEGLHNFDIFIIIEIKHPFTYGYIMEEHDAVRALAALAQEHRLKVFRLLVQHAAQGLAAGQIAVQVGIPASTMSSHLAHLERAGLLRSWRDQRRIMYAADTAGIHRLLTFLTDECCGGQPQLCGFGDTRELPPAPVLWQAGPSSPPQRCYTVLFLCTGNSARSIMAEAILQRLAPGTFQAYSAGSHPKGAVHPYALDVLHYYRYPTNGLRSKSWAEFHGPAAPALDCVITLCDEAASEPCPLWPGQPLQAHWGLPDPAAVVGSEAVKRFAFVDALRTLMQRLDIFVTLPVLTCARPTLQQHLNDIGRLCNVTSTLY